MFSVFNLLIACWGELFYFDNLLVSAYAVNFCIQEDWEVKKGKNCLFKRDARK
jgi:hypothetical protein